MKSNNRDRSKASSTLLDGTVYSQRKNWCPFTSPPVESYIPIVGEDRIAALQRVAQGLNGLKMLELSATARGGGVAEMLYSSVPFLNALGVETEWRTINGNEGYFECTKKLHNLLQGMKGSFTAEMRRIYLKQLEDYTNSHPIDFSPEVVVVHDPQPLGISQYLHKDSETWIWRCHIDVEPIVKSRNGLLKYITDWITYYDAAILSAVHYVYPPWPLPKFVIPPFIDPFSEKNRELTQEEIDKVLIKYQIDPSLPIIAQIGRFDPWKGLDRTIAVYRQVREDMKCQLILAGGFADDDPEGGRILEDVRSKTKGDDGIRVIKLSLDNRLDNYREVNALQRAASIIMQPSTREGFGLVITEALWKGKPVIAGNVGGIPLQIRDGETGYFYQDTAETAQLVMYLLNNPRVAATVGKNGRKHVARHFMLPDRIADFLMAIDMTINSGLNKERHHESITSFHPWFTRDMLG